MDEEKKMIFANRIIKTILEYESDTFSAEGTHITEDEAMSISEIIIEHWFNSYLDGTIITQELMDCRGVDEQDELYDVVEKEGVENE